MRTVEEVVAANELYTAYQAVVDLDRKEVFAYEALVRTHAKEFPNPLALIGAAVEQGFMGQLGRHLRKLAVDGCPGSRLFLNVHPNEFDEQWLVRPDDSTTTHGHQIYLEITESVPLSHFRHCHSVLAELRTRGANIAIDDLGAGYSNLKYIVDLTPEIVKLDRELVANLHVEPRLRVLVTALVKLCEQLGAKVVGEGIETADELSAVIDTGVHYGQGYYLQRPNVRAESFNWKALG